MKKFPFVITLYINNKEPLQRNSEYSMKMIQLKLYEIKRE